MTQVLTPTKAFSDCLTFTLSLGEPENGKKGAKEERENEKENIM